MTSGRDQQVKAVVRDIRIKVPLCELRHLASNTAAAFERADAAVSKELRALIDDGRPNNSSQ